MQITKGMWQFEIKIFAINYYPHTFLSKCGQVANLTGKMYPTYSLVNKLQVNQAVTPMSDMKNSFTETSLRAE